MSQLACCLSIRVERRPTVELTRRRQSKHPPPHQASYETRSRRSRPTICWARRLVYRRRINTAFEIREVRSKHFRKHLRSRLRLYNVTQKPNNFSRRLSSIEE